MSPPLPSTHLTTPVMRQVHLSHLEAGSPPPAPTHTHLARSHVLIASGVRQDWRPLWAPLTRYTAQACGFVVDIFKIVCHDGHILNKLYINLALLLHFLPTFIEITVQLGVVSLQFPVKFPQLPVMLFGSVETLIGISHFP